MILPRPDDPVDEDAIRFDGIENAIALVGSPPDAMFFVTRDQREGARHVREALRGIAQLVDEGDRARRIVFLDIGSDGFEVAAGP